MNKWNREKDFVEIRKAGYHAIIKRQEMGHLCGYIGVPKTHKRYGLAYDDVDVLVHGGLTFSESGEQMGWDEDLWYFGFDCAHSGDLVPELNKYRSDSFSSQDVYRTVDYVHAELDSLFAQLQELA